MIHPVGWAREPLLAMSSYASVDTMEARSGRVSAIARWVPVPARKQFCTAPVCSRKGLKHARRTRV